MRRTTGLKAKVEEQDQKEEVRGGGEREGRYRGKGIGVREG